MELIKKINAYPHIYPKCIEGVKIKTYSNCKTFIFFGLTQKKRGKDPDPESSGGVRFPRFRDKCER